MDAVDRIRDLLTRSVLGRAVAIYLPLCWLVLQVTDTFVQQLGLPSWVFTGTLVLLGLGLIVVVAWAALADRLRRASEPAAAAGEATEAPVRRLWLSRRRLVLGGVAVLAAWGLLTAGYMGARAAGLGPAGTLVAKGEIAPGGQVLLADFANRTGDPNLDDAIRQALAIDLGQSQLVTVADPRQVAGALQRMEREADAPLTSELAREVALREGYAAVLEGALSSLGPATLITARLVDPKTGAALASFDERARKPDELLEATDRLTAELRNKIGESLKVLRAEPPLEQVTTRSLPALRLYSEAQNASFAGDRQRSLALLEQAVEIDPGFAMAWRRLGLELRNMGRDPARSQAAIRTAYKHRDRLPYRERGLTEGAYWTTVPNYERARTAYIGVLELYPADTLALNGAAAAESALGNPEAAIVLNRRIAAIPPPRVGAYGNMVLDQLRLGRAEAAQATIAEAAARFPDLYRVSLLRIFLSEATGDWARSFVELAVMRERFPDPEARYEADYIEASMRLARGDVMGASAAARRLAARDAADDLTHTALLDLTLPVQWLAYSGRTAEAQAVIADAMRRYPLAAMAEADRPHFELAELLGMAGDAEGAQEHLAAAEAASRRDLYVQYDRPAATKGWIALAAGRPAEAVEYFTAGDRYGQSDFAMLVPLGRALEAAGRPREARQMYARRAAALAYDQTDLGFALERLAALDAAAGDRAGAARAASRLAALWTTPETRARVLAARALAGPVHVAAAP